MQDASSLQGTHDPHRSEPELRYFLARRTIGLPTWQLYARTLLGMLLWLSLIPVLAGVLGRLGARGAMHRLERWWARRVACHLDIQLEVAGLEHIDSQSVYIITPLHEGFADVLALLHLPFDLRFAARDELFAWRFLGRYLRATGHINVSPEQGRRAYRRLVKAAVNVFTAGRASLSSRKARSWASRQSSGRVRSRSRVPCGARCCRSH